MDLRDASAFENVEHVDIVYNVGVDFKHCRAMLKQCQAFIVNKISKNHWLTIQYGSKRC